ncbi:MAG: ABC transporter permease [Deltaproteobacteria bacterium]|nr:ABC transporter permease [Deltaproteobacteria bacterium]MBW2084942.1 ABC transporter permease [Deltaproteobacteria bacterium]
MNSGINDEKRKTNLKLAWLRLKRNRIALTGMVIILLFFLTGIFASHLAPHDPFKQDLDKIRTGLSFEHPLGCDQVGRDVLSRIIYGALITIKIVIISVAIGLFIGSTIGIIGGYYGRKVDMVVIFLADLLLAFPGLILAIAIIAAAGTGLTGVILAIGLSSIPQFIRVTRSVVIGEKESDYVLAARAIGEGDLNIMVRYILPNCLAPIVVLVMLRIAIIILIASGLSFLGLGVQPPTPEWGAMLAEGRAYLQIAPHIVIFPGLAIMIVVLAFNLFGDGLRDALDPRMKM